MLDSAAVSQTGQAIITRGDQMNAMGCKWIPVEKFPGSRIARIKNFHQLLAPNPKSLGQFAVNARHRVLQTLRERASNDSSIAA